MRKNHLAVQVVDHPKMLGGLKVNNATTWQPRWLTTPQDAWVVEKCANNHLAAQVVDLFKMLGRPRKNDDTSPTGH